MLPQVPQTALLCAHDESGSRQVVQGQIGQEAQDRKQKAKQEIRPKAQSRDQKAEQQVR